MTRLRAVKDTDIDLLFEWANDSTVRQNSFSSDLISYEDHVSWFGQMMCNEDVLLYILVDDDVPVGQIRLTKEDGSAEVGYSIAAQYRGYGYGHIILQLIIQEIKSKHPEIRKLIAKVKPENIASNKLFIDEGYSIDYHQYSYDLTV